VRRRRVLAFAVALAAAEVAVLLLRPRGVPTPSSVDVKDFFSPDQVAKAEAYRRPQIALFGAQLVVQAGVLVWLVARPPARLTRDRRHPLLAGAAAGAGISLVLAAATLPLSAVAEARARDVGLSTQDWGGWALDAVRAAGIGAVLAGAGGLLAVALLRRFPRRWWIPGAGIAAALAVAFLWLAPVVLDPVFNRFTRLPHRALRAEVLALARKAGVDVGEVYEVDASRRTTALNAYVTGLGRTKRVVLYDTLVHRAGPAETRLVVAHELGHVHYHDVPRGVLYVLLIAPFATYAVFLLTEGMTGRSGTAAGLPALVLALGLVSTPVGWISNGLSRGVEARADQFALELTHDPRAAIALEKQLALSNVSDPDPPGWTRFLATHPTTRERIGQAIAFENRRR
jgi:STE24 endopeptidase